EHTLANGINIDYHYAYTRNHEDRPDEHNTDFTLKFDDFASTSNLAGVEGMEFGGLIAPKDPLGFSFDQDEIQNLNLKDRDHVAVLNALLPFTGESVYGNVKFGFKGRFKDRISDHSGLIMEAGDEDFYLPGGVNTTEFPPKATDFRPEKELVAYDQIADDPGEASVNYEASEDVLAGYIQSQIWFGNKLMILPGIRVEKTSTKNLAKEKTEADYTDFLPSFHLRYKVAENSNLRFAISRAISRPNYFDLVPYNYVDDDERLLGNPELDPVRATNLDLLFEHFDPRLAGILSAGVFYKKLKNPVEFFESDPSANETNPDVGKVIQPKNAKGDGTIKGFEVAVQKSLEFMGLRGFGIVANYTFSDGTLKLDPELGRDKTERRLTGQSKHLFNLALNYENPHIGFSGQIAWKFRSDQLEASGEGNADDPWEDDYSRVDLSINQRVFGGITFFLEGRNLTDEPLRFFVNNPTTRTKQDLQVEYYGRSFLSGFKLNL
ncbi:MAG: TonB-dependent receptor domain-containing protein, partial [bacterium]